MKILLEISELLHEMSWLSVGARIFLAVILLFQTDAHDTAIGSTAAQGKGLGVKLLERLDAGRRQIDLNRQILTAAEQVNDTHILACLACALGSSAEGVQLTGRAYTTGFANTYLTVQGTAQRLVILVIVALGPVGAVCVVM